MPASRKSAEGIARIQPTAQANKFQDSRPRNQIHPHVAMPAANATRIKMARSRNDEGSPPGSEADRSMDSLILVRPVRLI